MSHHPLRFCLVTTFYPPYSFGGDAIFVQRLAYLLADQGHHVEVVHCLDAYRLLSSHKPDQDEILDRPGVRVHRLHSWAGLLWPIAMQQTGGPAFEAHRLRTLLDSGFDVIHFHNVSLMGGPEILTYGGSAIKLYTMHEYWLVCPTHVMYKFDREPCVSPSCLACTLLHKRPPQWWRYTGKLERALESLDALLAISQFSIDLHKRMGLKRKMELLPLFVPEEPLAKRQGDGDRPRYFLFVGRLEKIKGLHRVISAFRGSLNAELWIAGTGSQQQELRRMAAENSKVKFLGHVTGPPLSELYRNAIAVLIPSLCYEVFPLVILEAFRQKTPVVVRDIGGLREIVETSGGGVAFGDEAELPELLGDLAKDGERRDALGTGAYDAFRRQWTPEVHLKHYLSIIDGIREGKR